MCRTVSPSADASRQGRVAQTAKRAAGWKPLMLRDVAEEFGAAVWLEPGQGMR